MKCIVSFTLIGAVLLGMGPLTSCKSRKLKAPKGEVEIVVPCSGKDFWSNKEVFRANAVGESKDQMVSRKKAISNARADLASSINTTIKGTIDNYVNSREFNNQEDVEERFEGLTREVINQELAGVETICEKVFTTEDSTYKTYIAIEMSGEDLLGTLNETLSKDERLRIDYDYEKFREEFKREMDKLENSN